MKNLWVHKTYSFRKAKEFDEDYYLKMSRMKRLETMQFLREIYSKIKKGSKNYEDRERLRRVIRIIQ